MEECRYDMEVIEEQSNCLGLTVQVSKDELSHTLVRVIMHQLPGFHPFMGLKRLLT